MNYTPITEEQARQGYRIISKLMETTAISSKEFSYLAEVRAMFALIIVWKEAQDGRV